PLRGLGGEWGRVASARVFCDGARWRWPRPSAPVRPPAPPPSLSLLWAARPRPLHVARPTAAVGCDPRGGGGGGSGGPVRLRRRQLRARQRRTGAAGAGPALERPPSCSMCSRRGLLWLPRRSLLAALFFFSLSSSLLYSVYVAPGIGSCFEYPQSLV
ncbi:uncharacterized protein LOC144372889, partial [Ictidomys tridecemlineatus]